MRIEWIGVCVGYDEEGEGSDLRGSSHSGGCESFGAAAQQVLKWRIVNGPPEQQRTVNKNWQAAE